MREQNEIRKYSANTVNLSPAGRSTKGDKYTCSIHGSARQCHVTTRTLQIHAILHTSSGFLLLNPSTTTSPICKSQSTQIGVSSSRSEERRVGKECVRTCRSRCSEYH